MRVIPKPFDIRPHIFNFAVGSSIGALTYCHFFAHPRRNGFYCADQSIRKPYLEQTITESMLLIGIFVIPAVVILLCEGARYFTNKEIHIFHKRRINQIIPNFLKYYGYLLMVFTVITGATTACKYLVGRLRPHFFTVCNPVFDNRQCVNNTYITDYNCTGIDQGVIEEARKSFFSGHASETMAVAIFLVVYLQKRTSVRSYVVVIRHIVQIALVGLSLYTGYTRIVNNMHYLSDILVGFIVGAIIGIFPWLYIEDYKYIGKMPVGYGYNYPFIDESVTSNDKQVKSDTPRSEPQGVQISSK